MTKSIKAKIKKPPESSGEIRGLEMILLREIKKQGCPVCSSNASNDERYFSWFPIEIYHEPAFLKEIEASFGFCKRHGAFLETQAQLIPQIDFVHDFIAGKTYDRLSSYLQEINKLPDNDAFTENEKNSDFGFPNPCHCPVCASSKTTITRTLWFFNKLLKNGSAFADYGHPGILCFNHLQLLVKKATPEIIHRLIPFHNKAISNALNAMKHANSSQIRAGIMDNTCKTGLDLSIGSVSNHNDQIFLHRIYNKDPVMDPMTGFIASLENTECCPVCLYENAALSRWINWLNEEIDTSEHPDDTMSGVLPTCREHVMACVHLGQPPLQFAVVYNALKATHTNILIAEKQLNRLNRLHNAPLWQRFAKKNQNTGDVGKIDIREAVTSPIRCPACVNLKMAEKRAFDLLFALLEERRHKRSFENGYGLCVKHFIKASKAAPSNEILKFLVKVESAKLAFLKWELDEIMRKMAWDTRHEPKGREQSAWRRSIARFSGLTNI